MTNYCRNKQVKSTKIRISSWFLFFIGLSRAVTFYWMFPHLYDYFGVSMLRVFTWMGRVWGARDGGGAKSSLLPLTSLCVSSPTHTCSPHWISFPFSNRKNELIFYIWQFCIFARSFQKKIQVFLAMRCWSEWKDWSSRAHNLIYIIYNLISWLTRKQQNIYSTALGTKAELFVNWGKMHKIKHSHRGLLLLLSLSK